MDHANIVRDDLEITRLAGMADGCTEFDPLKTQTTQQYPIRGGPRKIPTQPEMLTKCT